MARLPASFVFSVMLPMLVYLGFSICPSCPNNFILHSGSFASSLREARAAILGDADANAVGAADDGFEDAIKRCAK